MSNIPDEQLVLVGRLWPKLEGAVKATGVQGADMSEKIDNLRGRYSEQVISNLHYVRLQRNRLTHDPYMPLQDSSQWESLCRECISTLGGQTGNQGPNDAAVSLIFKIAAWGIGAYVVLNNEKLLELLLLGGLCYFLYNLFFKKK